MQSLFLPKVVWFALLLALPFGAIAEEQEAKKVVILVSSTGNGHISQAEALAEKVKRESPGSEVVIKVMEDFSKLSPAAVKREQWLFLQMMEKTPNLVESIAARVLNNGNQAPDFARVQNVFDLDAMKGYLDKQKPDVIVSAYYGGARAMATLREHGHFQDVPNGYIVTELTEGYTPRIARRLDRVFLPDPSFARVFRERGVPEEKMAVTGLPVNHRLLEPVDKAKFMRENDLIPDGKTIVMVSGGDGKGNLPGIAKELIKKVAAPVNIIVVAGRNEKAKAQLDAMQKTLPKGVRLLATGLVPNQFVVDALRSADLFVGKAGGMMAAEVITAGKPAIFIKMLGGHEAEIWKRLGKEGYAEINNDLSTIGDQAQNLLYDQTRIDAMLARQKEFREGSDPHSADMLDFVFNGESSYTKRLPRLGEHGGRRPRETGETLKQLEEHLPRPVDADQSQIELLYMIPAHAEAEPFSQGSLAVAVDGKVAVVEQGEGGPKIRWVPKERFLYSVRVKDSNEMGQVYGNDVFSVVDTAPKSVVSEVLKGLDGELDREGLSRRLLQALGKRHKGSAAEVFDQAAQRNRIPRELPLPPKDANDPVVVHYAPIIESPEDRQTVIPPTIWNRIRRWRGIKPTHSIPTDADFLVEMDPTNQSLVFDNFRHQQPVAPDFGLAGGSGVEGVAEALAEMERRAPGDVEILLSFTTSPRGTSSYRVRREPGFHPFGHIAIRVGETVYNIEYQADSKDDVLVRAIPFEEYLYGTTPSGPHADMGADFGVAYVRDTIGVRLSVTQEQKEGIVGFVEEMNRKWREGEAKFDPFCSNCADFTRDAFLENAPDEVKQFFQSKRKRVAVPLDIFDQIRDSLSAENLPAVVRYHQVKDSRNPNAVSEFPLSPFQVLRALGLITLGGNDSLELQVEQSIVNDHSSTTLEVRDGPQITARRSRCPFSNLVDFSVAKGTRLPSRSSAGNLSSGNP